VSLPYVSLSYILLGHRPSETVSYTLFILHQFYSISGFSSLLLIIEFYFPNSLHIKSN
jgi:hypothetical protein